jgi:hypothetical protein
VISAESLFTLIDLCGLSPDEAVARRTTAAAVGEPGGNERRRREPAA